ncbi:MAG TPA: peptidylprolyl isomerase [Candidatus Binatus sp.]|nr:peptidylprolyl isomerase [Candidatus Binatus sp.]
MRRIFAILIAAGVAAGVASTGGAQSSSTPSSSTTQAAPAAPTGTAAKPAVHVATKPTAIIKTTVGDMTCTLFPDKAPLGVANFIGLASGTKDWKNPVSGATKHGVPLYDGTIFHRVIPEFMIQGGDPAGNGRGDPGYKFKNEVSSDLLFDRPGRLSYANAGRDTNGSQFFITEVATPSLNGGYTIFGQCNDAAVVLVKQIARMATDPATDHMPLRPVKIIHISIVHSTGAAAKPGAGTTVKKPATAKPAAPANPN